MPLSARLRSALRNWPPLRRRMLAALLTAGLLAAAFYGTETLRGSLAVASAIEEAQRAGVPVSLGEVFAREPPAERNLFLAPVLKSRIVEAVGPADYAGALKVQVPWGAIHPRSAGKGTKRYPVSTSPSDGRRLNLTAVQEAMAALSWTLPEMGTPAEKVRGGLDRFQTELEEWTAEVRKRPEWGMPADEAADFQVYEKALEEVSDVLGLRAVAAAAAGRDGAEILRDLECVSLLNRHLWNRIGTVNKLLWEVLATRHLKDAELEAAGALLMEEPPYHLLLRKTYWEGLAYNEGFLSHCGDGGDPATCQPAYLWQVDLERTAFPRQTWWRERLSPLGWYRLSEARQIDCMITGKRQAEAALAAWQAGNPLPDTRSHPDPPLWRHPMPLPFYNFTFAEHLMSCGCQLSTTWQAAVEARMAMAAIGLERHRLRTGKWPDSLDEAAGLIPGGLKPVPSLGTPVIYTRLPDGGWRLTADRNTPSWIMPEQVE